MRLPKFLSPSAIGLWGDNREEYYLRYLADNRPPRMPQTPPMSIGAAFDAYAKNYISERLFGVGAKPEFEFETVFETQVETQNRDWARLNGKHAFEAYQKSGALSNLMLELSKSKVEPRMEFTVQGEVQGIPLLGKPDLYFVSEADAHIIVDWKVNGYCAKRGKSPARGYVLCRDGWEGDQSRSHNRRHKDCHPYQLGGLIINIAEFMENVNEGWARQLCIYAWLLGEDVGSNFIICIEQLACAPDGDFPKIRVASHRMRASRQYQLDLMNSIEIMWEAVHVGDIFEEDNEKTKRRLDRVHKAFAGTSDKDEWFNKMQGRG